MVAHESVSLSPPSVDGDKILEERTGETSSLQGLFTFARLLAKLTRLVGLEIKFFGNFKALLALFLDSKRSESYGYVSEKKGSA